VFPSLDGVGAVHCPRRYLLDKILLDAAVVAGVEFRPDFIVEELLSGNGRVTGLRGRLKNGSSVSEQARIIIGADGKHSLVAKAVNAPKYDEHPALTCGYYSYWEDVTVGGGEMYQRGPRMVGVWPSNDQKTIIYVAWPAAEFDRFRANVEA